MSSARRLLGFALLTFAPLALGAAPKWSELASGMDRSQVARTLGTPVLRNAARGHETWIYDAGASVQFHGGLVSAWTAPKPTAAPTATVVRAATAEPARVAQQLAAPVNPARQPPFSPQPS